MLMARSAAPAPSRFQCPVLWLTVMAAMLVLNMGLVLVLVPHAKAMLLLLPLLLLHLAVAGTGYALQSERRRTQTLREACEREFDFARQAMGSVEHGLTLLDGDGRMQYVNPAFEAMLGRPAGELLGHRPTEFAVSFLSPLAGEGRQPLETQLLCADGSLLGVQITSHPRWYQGRVVGNFASIVPTRPPYWRELN